MRPSDPAPRRTAPRGKITRRWPALSDGARAVLTTAALLDGEWFVNAENFDAAAELVRKGLAEVQDGDEGLDLLLTAKASALVFKTPKKTRRAGLRLPRSRPDDRASS
ncbi:hypothetical protein [Bradyrhizobium sp. CCBAU 11357]|uniref:hypothetical protein n=1 Tax=Bradyrhizobium sp. CCBAU 11357 TaxID=1630808 RepID=UPI002302D956|nr:hypothetical protein [Bradyrhizobium sp. CCBAU 11357]MDA9499308.1 hypothetical protein [Bradyrhizobium sp. CCBAU 11357]